DEVLVGSGELRAHDERERAADQEEQNRRCDVTEPDDLVVGRRHPPQDPGIPSRGRGRRRRRRRAFGRRRHRAPPGEAACCSVTQDWYSAKLTTLTSNVILAWSSPQNSAHLPVKVPRHAGVGSIWWQHQGSPSGWNRTAGSKNDGLTSGDGVTSLVVRSSGSTIVGSLPGCPVTVTSSFR